MSRTLEAARHAPVSRARQNYLKALLQLGAGVAGPGGARARPRGAAAPVLANMPGRPTDGRPGEVGPRAARLTGPGERAALLVLRRHRLLETFLARVLELDWSEVHEDAEELEHHVSDRVVDAIERFMGHPTGDPHGHPIPDRHGRLARRALSPLPALPQGSRARVCEVRGGADPARLVRWKRSGLVPGAHVRMLESHPDEGVFTLEIAGRRVVSGREGLDGVMIERRARGKA